MFFTDKNKDESELAKVAALLIHAAKIDQDFSKKELGRHTEDGEILKLIEEALD